MRALGLILTAIVIAGCASSSSEISSSYVSPLQYQHLTCNQIGAAADGKPTLGLLASGAASPH